MVVKSGDQVRGGREGGVQVGGSSGGQCQGNRQGERVGRCGKEDNRVHPIRSNPHMLTVPHTSLGSSASYAAENRYV